MEVLDILIIVIIILFAVYLSLALDVPLFRLNPPPPDEEHASDKPSGQTSQSNQSNQSSQSNQLNQPNQPQQTKGGSGACELNKQDMTVQPGKIPAGTHIVVDGMNMIYHIKRHREGKDCGGYIGDIQYYALIDEVAYILSHTFSQHMIHVIVKNFSHHSLHPGDAFSLSMANISRIYPNVVFHVAFDSNIYSKGRADHYLHGRDDLLSIVVFNMNLLHSKRTNFVIPAPYLISLDEYKDEHQFADIPQFIERQFYGGKIVAEHLVRPADISSAYLASIVDHPGLIKYEIIDGKDQETYPIDGSVYRQKNGNYLCANIFDISRIPAETLEW